jgi:hypothetical protein
MSSDAKTADAPVQHEKMAHMEPKPMAVTFVGQLISAMAFGVSLGNVTRRADRTKQVVSAMTEVGLNMVNLSQMTTWQQLLLFLLILLGSSIWVSICTVAAHLQVFEKRFEDIVRAERER